MSLEIKNVIKSYDGIINAVDDLSFKVDQGEILGLIGVNGAGKSTLSKMICGILQPTSGEVLFDNIPSYKYNNNIKRKLGVLFGQRSQLWWDLPVNDTFQIYKVMYEISDDDYNDMIKIMNDYLSINQYMDKVARSLSLGQKTLVNIALTLLHKPKLVILDEPTIGLDFIIKQKIREFIKYYNKTFRTTFIITSHDLLDIETLCKRILVINKGNLIYDGEMDNLIKISNSNEIIVIKKDEFIFSSDIHNNKIKSSGNAYYFRKEYIKDNIDYFGNNLLLGNILSIKVNEDFSAVLEKMYEK